MSEFKVGNDVKCLIKGNRSDYFKGIRKIDFITTGVVHKTVIGIGETCYLPEDLELVCGFTENQKIQCSMTNQNWEEYKFYGYDPNLAFPFLVKGTVNGFDNRIISFLYAREIKVVE